MDVIFSIIDGLFYVGTCLLWMLVKAVIINPLAVVIGFILFFIIVACLSGKEG